MTASRLWLKSQYSWWTLPGNHMQSDEIFSNPLVPGQRPELPGLIGNKFWQSQLRRVRPYDGSIPGSGPRYHFEEELAREVKDEQVAEGLAKASRTLFLKHHQSSIRPE
eukprot:160891-Karenia_brevis.AAC.1